MSTENNSIISHDIGTKNLRYHITQHKCAKKGKLLVEVLEVKDSGASLTSRFIIVKVNKDYYSYSEWASKDDALYAFARYWGNTRNNKLFAECTGFKGHIELGELRPWFYATYEEAIIGGFVVPDNLKRPPIFFSISINGYKKIKDSVVKENFDQLFWQVSSLTEELLATLENLEESELESVKKYDYKINWHSEIEEIRKTIKERGNFFNGMEEIRKAIKERSNFFNGEVFLDANALPDFQHTIEKMAYGVSSLYDAIYLESELSHYLSGRSFSLFAEERRKREKVKVNREEVLEIITEEGSLYKQNLYETPTRSD